jgi:hypothetical protein
VVVLQKCGVTPKKIRVSVKIRAYVIKFYKYIININKNHAVIINIISKIIKW